MLDFGLELAWESTAAITAMLFISPFFVMIKYYRYLYPKREKEVEEDDEFVKSKPKEKVTTDSKETE